VIASEAAIIKLIYVTIN